MSSIKWHDIAVPLGVAGLVTEGVAQFGSNSAERRQWETWHYVIAVILFVGALVAKKQCIA